jgi:hypothetical protein
VTPVDVREIECRLVRWLRDRPGHTNVRIVEPLCEEAIGLEVRTFKLRLGALPDGQPGDVFLRLFADGEGERPPIEACVQNFAAAQGFPAPRALHFETESSALGGPFVLMARAPGVQVGFDPFTARASADALVHLHSLEVDALRRALESHLESIEHVTGIRVDGWAEELGLA